ncbi:C40 family peptidase [Acaricomes phytoseiuli]|uniref:NlpC/P60 family protein n=1 Tax=Acaricomes phytoseiuli TaxID=291968 RepID=UPI0003654ADB|nr:NlpC/P60 family protein [Acaricomes phytoseiuli]MCW1249493.1 C40 family peptidase [Acaricomes phytoseiuli]
MSNSRIARHRAEPAKTNSMAVIAKTIGGNAGSVSRQAAVVAAASGLVLSGGVVAQGSTNEGSIQASANNVSAAPATVTANFSSVTASPSAHVVFEAPAAASKPAPKPVAAKPQVETQSNSSAQQSSPAAAPKPAAAAPAADGKAGSIGAGVAAAAYAQLGQTQDCTALVRRALSAMGLPTTPMGPEYFRTLGRVLGPGESPKPGDIAYYSNNGYGSKHIAIYVGNGQAVHGGWLGNQTVLGSVIIPTGAPDYYVSVTDN